jgi:hypothetical protein
MVGLVFEIRNWQDVTKCILDGVDHKTILDTFTHTQGWKLELSLILHHLKMYQLH